MHVPETCSATQLLTVKMPREKIVNVGLVGEKTEDQPEPEPVSSPRKKCVFITVGSVLAVVIATAVVVGVYSFTRSVVDETTLDIIVNHAN